jgi:ribonuclease P protein subunit RPR2
MGKGKSPGAVIGRHNYSRASYLYQAAVYLASQAQNSQDAAAIQNIPKGTPMHSEHEKKALENMSRQAITDMRAVTLKSQIRQNADLKRMICKFCDTLQLEGKTSVSTVENRSRGGRKPWADVLVIRCKTCDNVKRYPISAPRQKRRSLRDEESSAVPSQEQDGERQPAIQAT